MASINGNQTTPVNIRIHEGQFHHQAIANREVNSEEKQVLKLKDAVGRKYSIPFTMVKTWQVSGLALLMIRVSS